MKKLIIGNVDFTNVDINQANQILKNGSFNFEQARRLAKHYNARIKILVDGRDGSHYRNLVH